MVIDLDELRRLLKEASPGPWWVDLGGTAVGRGDGPTHYVLTWVKPADGRLIVALRNAAEELLTLALAGDDPLPDDPHC